mmetsp:Transcript_92488/g.261279  ORF Transcript_92488/g.261279 Transcript_92488/m.261279 type:complete len:123 (-) Transcript_92488:111-479(-)
MQVPLLLLVNGGLGVWYANKVSDGTCPAKALYVHVAGTLLALVQPVFSSGGIIQDLQTSFSTEPVKPPAFTTGGLWHHGWLMAACQVTGLVLIVYASLLASHFFETLSEQLDATDRQRSAES